MNHVKFFRALAIAGLVILVSATFVSAATFVLLATGAGTIDGNPNEWGNITSSANPYFLTNVCVGGDCVNQPQVGRLYGHYTCDNNMLYFIVSANTGLANTANATNNFLAQNTPGNIIMSGGTPYTSNTNQNAPIWRYLTTGGSGFEAAYPFNPGTLITLYVQAFINTTPGGQPQIASTGVHNYIVPGCGTTAVTLSSFNAQNDVSTANWALGLVGILGMVGLTGASIALWRRMI